MPLVTVGLLGTTEIRYHGEPITLPTRKALALLTYLIVESGRHSRERLTAMLWPDSDAERGRTALRKTLMFVRDALSAGDRSHRSPVLVVERDQLGVDVTAVDLDLRVLERAWQLALPTRQLPNVGDERLAQLEAAFQCYRGDFMDGFTLDDAPDFENWLLIQRERWQRRFRIVCDRLSQMRLDRGEAAHAVEIASKWVATAPWHEAAHRRLIEAHLAAGDRAAARRAYEDCRTILARELEVPPSPETEALARRITPPSSGVRRVTTTEMRSRADFEVPMIGRDREHLALVTAFREAQRGRTRVVLVEGEPGIGKTRLAQEFLKWAGTHGADIMRAKAIATTESVSYQFLVSALRERIERDNAPDDLLNDVWLRELSRLLPELRDRYPDLPPPSQRSDLEGRTHLFEAVVQLVLALAERSPVVLFMDDLHWADAASLDVLQYAVQRWSTLGLPVLLVACARTDEIVTTSLLVDWLTNLDRVADFVRIRLGPLTEEGTRQFVQALVEGGCRDALTRRIAEETGGHPLFIREMLKSLADQGLLLRDAEGRWVISGSEQLDRWLDLRQWKVPSSIQQVIRARLSRLSFNAQMLLMAGAVLGYGARFESFRDVAAIAEDAALSALDEALRRQVLVEHEGTYAFTHDMIREVVYAEMNAARRQIFHRRALESGERRGAPPADLARHAIEAGLWERALHWCVVTGVAAMQRFAIRDAITHFERANDVAERLSIEANASQSEVACRSDLGELYVQLGRAYELNGDIDQARAVYQTLLAVAMRTGEAKLEWIAANRLATLLAQKSEEFVAARSLLHRARAAAERSGDAVGVAETVWNLAQLGFYAWDPEVTRVYGTQALALARQLGLPDLVARSYNVLSYAAMMVGNWEESEQQAREARASYRAQGNRAMEVDCLNLIAEAQISTGRARAGFEAARIAFDISREIRNPWGMGNSTVYLAASLIEIGLLDQALRAARQGVIIARAHRLQRLLIFNLLMLGACYRSLLLVDAARETHREAIELTALSAMRIFEPLLLAELCADAVSGEDWSAAYDYARRAIAFRREGRHLVYHGRSRWCQTAALIRGGDAALAKEDLAQFRDHQGNNQRYQIPYLRGLAELTAAEGDPARAIEHLEEAYRHASQLDLPGECWEIAATLRDMYQQCGELAAAGEARQRAAQMLRRIADRLAPGPVRTMFVTSPRARRVLDWQ